MVSIRHLLNRECTIRRQKLSPDGQGGFSHSLAVHASKVPGRRQAASGAEREVAAREESQVTHVWYFDKGTELKPRDVIVSPPFTDEVVALLPPSVDDFVKVQTKEIQLGDTV